MSELAGGLGGASSTQLATALAQRASKTPDSLAAGRQWGHLGDSITNGSSAAAGRRFIDVLPWMIGTQSMAPGPVLNPVAGALYNINAGVPGDRTDQMLARTDALIAQGISGMTLLGGANDAAQGVSPATFIANVAAIAAKCRAASIPLVVGTVPPRGSGAAAAIKQLVAAYNAALRVWAPSAGVPLARVHSALVDISSGDMLAAYNSGDDTHPNTAGHRLVAAAFATACATVIPPRPPLVTAKSAASLVANPLFVAGASSWFEQPGGTGTAPTYSTIADATGRLPVGAQWREMDFDATAAGGQRILATGIASSAAWAPGDKVLFAASLDIVDVAGFYAASTSDPFTASVVPRLVDQSGVTMPLQITLPPLGQVPGELATVVQIPAATTAMNVWFVATLPTGVHAKLRVSAVDVINLSALGISGY